MPAYKVPCPRCGQFIMRDVAVCPFCQSRDPFAPIRCVACNTIIEDARWTACPRCGTAVPGRTQPAAAAPAAPAAPPAPTGPAAPPAPTASTPPAWGGGPAQGTPPAPAATPQPAAAPAPPAPAAPPAAPPAQKFCTGCGAAITAGARFCTTCGTLAG